jgi:hypothetical protein
MIGPFYLLATTPKSNAFFASSTILKLCSGSSKASKNPFGSQAIEGEAG